MLLSAAVTDLVWKLTCVWVIGKFGFKQIDIYFPSIFIRQLKQWQNTSKILLTKLKSVHRIPHLCMLDHRPDDRCDENYVVSFI